MVLGTLLVALFYAAPSAYQSVPTLQLRPFPGNEDDVGEIAETVERILRDAGVAQASLAVDGQRIDLEFGVGDEAARAAARAALDAELGERMVIAPNSATTAPAFFGLAGAEPIALGLDLRGGVHFLLEVDIPFAVNKYLEGELEALKSGLREARLRYRQARIDDGRIRVEFSSPEEASSAAALVRDGEYGVAVEEESGRTVALGVTEQTVGEIRDLTIEQNLETLRNRVDELGVAEPVITRQGADRIAVQLPGVQDTARAKDILGRTASLGLHGVDATRTASRAAIAAAKRGRAPRGTILVDGREGDAYILEADTVITGENITNARPGFDQGGQPAVHIDLDNSGGARMRAYTRDHVGDQLAIVMLERGRSEVISAPVIQEELSTRFLIHGSMTTEEANELALLLRAGSLSAPLSIIEERTVGPSLGADNIRRGLNSIKGGFLAVALFIAAYYMVFGAISVGALAANLLCLTALLATLQAALTLPGLAGFALTLGMAIDANVLINERIREELGSGTRPALAIREGYDRAFITILDANVTTLIAGIALFWFGSGPVRGFAVVLSLGILTSMFTAVVVSRSLVDLVYTRRPKLAHLSIG